MATWTNTCEYDGKQFQAQRSTSRFCSTTCRVRARRAGAEGLGRNAKRNASRRAVEREVKQAIDDAIGPALTGRVLSTATSWPMYLDLLASRVGLKTGRTEREAEAVVIEAIGSGLGMSMKGYSLTEALGAAENDRKHQEAVAKRATANAAEWKEKATALSRQVAELKVELARTRGA